MSLTPHQRAALERWNQDGLAVPVTDDVSVLLDHARNNAPLSAMQAMAVLVAGAENAGMLLDVLDTEHLATAAAVAANTVEAFVWDMSHVHKRSPEVNLIPQWRWRQLLNFARYTVNGYPEPVIPRLSRVCVAVGPNVRPTGLMVGTTSLPLALLRGHLIGGRVYQANKLPTNRLKGALSQCPDTYRCLNSRVVIDAAGVKWRQVSVDDADRGEINPCACTRQPLVNLGGDEDLLDLYDPNGQGL